VLNREASYAIAGLSIVFDDAGLPALEPMRADWRHFARPVTDASIRIELTLSAAVTRPEGWLPMLPDIQQRPDGSLALEGDGFRAEISADRTRATVHQPPERFPLEALIRVLVADSVLQRGGLLVHGAALAHDGRAALFTGFSGAGKSTLSAWGSRGGLTLLADELVAVLPEGDGFSACGTPWNRGGAGRATLECIGVLAHAAEARLTPVEPSTVLRVLLSNVLEPGNSGDVRARVFRVASRLLNAVPTRELAFAPNLEVAAVLKKALAAA
jgi:hypothetical protein